MRISWLTLIGIVLVILGVVSFTYHGIPYTSGVTAVDVGSLKTHVGTRETIPISPLLIVLALTSGAALIAFGSKKSS